LSLSDTLNTSTGKSTSLTESLSLSDTLNTSTGKSTSLTESLSLSDIVNKTTIRIQTDLLSLNDNLITSRIPANNTLPVNVYPGSTTTKITVFQNNTSLVLTNSSTIETIIIDASAKKQLAINYTSSLSSNSSGTFVSLTTGFDIIFNTTNTNSANIGTKVTIPNSVTFTGTSGWNGILNLPTT
ncbi:MAG: hypothetical protein COW26_03680, partial [Nitrosopumilales archaeon CG15_BIG_FIL_POST_REV_8_21_14_020_33_23]